MNRQTKRLMQRQKTTSQDRLEAMRQRHPHLEAVTVSGEGHAPLLKDAHSLRAIADFLQRTDAEAAYPAAA